MKLQLPSGIAVLLLLTFAAIACGDGGAVRVLQTSGEHQIAVFTSPTPLRAGPVDVSVLVQDSSGNVVNHVDVIVVAKAHSASGPSVRTPATSAAATNKLLRAAKFNLPTAGLWNFEVLVGLHGNTPASVAFQAEVAPPRPRWQSFWPWFTWPVAAIALFVLQQALRRRPTKRT